MELRPRWKDVVILKVYRQAFLEDGVRIAHQSELMVAQIARDFGVSEACVSNWVRKADIEHGQRPGAPPRRPRNRGRRVSGSGS